MPLSSGVRVGTLRVRVTGWLVLVTACVTACGPRGQSNDPSPADAGAARPIATLDGDAQAWVERTLGGMSPRAMAAQLIVAWLPGSYISTESNAFDDAAALVERGVGGIWLMGGLPYARAAKLNALQQRAVVPLIVFSSVGLGHQQLGHQQDSWVLGGGTDVPPQLAYAAVGDPDAAQTAGRIVGLEARATGTHISDGPEVNVLTNMNNVLISRTFGDDPALVGQLASAFVAGAHEAGMLTSAGFFPGAGDLGEDPHVRLPVVRTERQTLEVRELIPFRTVIGGGTDLVMTSHFAVPTLTGSDDLPVTLSADVIAVLRDELGYQGLVITDAFDMGGLDAFEPVDAAIRAFQAGHDLLLGPSALRVADALGDLAERGEISIEQLRTSVRRILEAKARLGLHLQRVVPLERIGTIVGRRPHQEAADSAASRSIVLLRDRESLVPLVSSSERSVLSVTMELERNREAGNAFNDTLAAGVRSVRRVRLSPSSPPAVYDRLRQAESAADLVVASIYMEPELGVDRQATIPDAFIEFVRRMQASGRPFLMASFGRLTVLDQVPELGSFLMAWSGQPVMQRAAARALLGISPITGRLPVALPPHHARGEGLRRDPIR